MPETSPEAHRRTKTKPKSIPRNKHGLPLFNEETDFSIYFRDGNRHLTDYKSPRLPPRKSPDEKSFEELLEASIAGKDEEMLLAEKTGGGSPDRPLTRAALLRHYPVPQETLDLHGYTAEQAAHKTETFVKKAGKRGKRTLMIIVGKGLHSDGRPVLPDVVEETVLDLKRQNHVIAFEWEKRKKRKSGALIVYLSG